MMLYCYYMRKINLLPVLAKQTKGLNTFAQTHSERIRNEKKKEQNDGDDNDNDAAADAAIFKLPFIFKFF